MKALLKRLFPNLVEAPIEVWFALPVGLMFLIGVAGGIHDLWERGPWE